jgi:glutamate/aspartate transport system ATP-binding protein
MAWSPSRQARIVVDGISRSAIPATNLPRLRARVGMVFQHFELFPHMSVRKNLALAQVRVLGPPRLRKPTRAA